MRLLGFAVLAMIAFAACGGPPGMPKVPPPEYEDEPMPAASPDAGPDAGADVRVPASVGGACDGDEGCAPGLRCVCLGIGPALPCGAGQDCATPCGGRVCADPKRPVTPPP